MSRETQSLLLWIRDRWGVADASFGCQKVQKPILRMPRASFKEAIACRWFLTISYWRSACLEETDLIWTSLCVQLQGLQVYRPSRTPCQNLQHSTSLGLFPYYLSRKCMTTHLAGAEPRVQHPRLPPASWHPGTNTCTASTLELALYRLGGPPGWALPPHAASRASCQRCRP